MTKESFMQKIKKPKEIINAFEIIRAQKLPLVIWGGGSMSHSVIGLCRKEGILFNACWIDNCTENETIHGLPVMELEELHKKFGRFNVVCGHSKYELAETIKKKYYFINEIYCLVNVCYEQWNGITYDFVLRHADAYRETYEMLEDNRSRECMTAFLNCKVNEDYRFILPCCDEKASYFNNSFFQMEDNEDYVDVGAYDGDTIREFLQAVSSYSHIYALEPEEDSYQKLVKYGNEHKLKNIQYFPYGSWNEDTVISFAQNQESSGIDIDGQKKLQVYKLDTLLKGRKVTLVKINFLNGVEETLQGATDILREQKPKLAITVGFDQWGIIRIPQTIKRINSYYKIYFRYAASMPARLILYAC